MLLKRPLDDRSAGIVYLIRQSASRMAGLINDVLDFARGRLGGGLALARNADQALLPILHQVIAELRAAHPQRVIEADFVLTEGVHCDPSRIGQLFSNLLGNALTHGAANTPIRARATTEGGIFELSVSNAGEPIPPEALERLFQPFFRADVQPTKQGLGLGLYIASEIARAHGGTMDATSTREETRFVFRMALLAS
jgi:signal transduction histidine kinase